jgi:hypothetical protein
MRRLTWQYPEEFKALYIEELAQQLAEASPPEQPPQQDDASPPEQSPQRDGA